VVTRRGRTEADALAGRMRAAVAEERTPSWRWILLNSPLLGVRPRRIPVIPVAALWVLAVVTGAPRGPFMWLAYAAAVLSLLMTALDRGVHARNHWSRRAASAPGTIEVSAAGGSQVVSDEVAYTRVRRRTSGPGPGDEEIGDRWPLEP
jgi:hypothetical protein